MAPTRMKLRVRGQQVEEEERGRESAGRSSSRRKNGSNAAAAAASSPPTSSASARAAAVVAAEEASPDSKCPICLDRFNNLAYLDRCLHRFCFPCIQEWSHNKAECPLCKQPFASILHSVRAEDDFKEYTLRPAPATSSVAATVAMVAAMASAARSDHQMRLMLRRHRAADGGGGETTARRRRRERGGRGAGSRRTGVWEWYLDSPSLPLAPLPHHPAVSPAAADDGADADDPEQRRTRGGADPPERGVIFEGLTGLGGAGAAAPGDRLSRRLMTLLAARQRLQREGGAVRRLRERETVAFRRALYRCGIRVRGVAGGGGEQGPQRDVTADSFRRNPAHLSRLRPWLRRELTVLYGAHGTLVDIVQRIITAQLARHGLEDTPTVEDELRPFLLARTDHFLHELVSFARSPLSLESYDQQAVYEPPPGAPEPDGMSSPSDSSSVIAISEGEEEEGRAGGRSEEAAAASAHDDVIQTGSCLSLSAWDDETPGPSYSTAAPSCSLASLSFSPAPEEAANEEAGGKQRQEEEGGEEECLIVGYKKPIAERTPELVQLSSDTEEEEEKEKEEEKTPAPSAAPPLSSLPTIPPSTSGAYREERDDKPKERDAEGAGRRSRSWSASSGRSRDSVLSLSPGERCRGDGKPPGGEAPREKRRRRKRRKRARERSGTLSNPNRSIYPAMMCRRSRSPSPFRSSVESGSPLPPSPPDSSWEYHCSPPTSSLSSPSRSSSPSSSSSSSPSPLRSSQRPSSPPTPSLSPCDAHHGEKPGGKRKYKSRHLDSNDKDPTWRPSRRRERGERRRRRGRDGRRRRERQRRDAHSYCGESSSSRRRRDDRSPSVEIIYEGTVAPGSAQPPARKRRRRRRRTQLSSSPVIITLDSDSSRDGARHKDAASGSSSPFSSQQTVDFSDLPPLPLVHSGGVGGALDAEIGELPVNILDRGSDGSDTEPAGPIAVDNSDSSDRDVDAENAEEGGSPPGAPGAIGKADATEPASEVATSDLLASILNDLRGIAAPPRDPPWDRQLGGSPEAATEGSRDRLGAGAPEGRRSDRNRGPASPTSAPPPLRQPTEVADVPPLLKQASPVRPYVRNTPPPLKHKDAGSPHLIPVSVADLRSPRASVDAESRLAPERPADHGAIPPISTLKSPFPRGAPDSGGFPEPSGSENGSRSAALLPHLDLNPRRSPESHSQEKSSSAPRSLAVHPHPVNSESHPAETGRSKETPAHADSTSGGRGNKILVVNSHRAAPVGLHLSSGVPAETGLGVFSGDSSRGAAPADGPADRRTLSVSAREDGSTRFASSPGISTVTDGHLDRSAFPSSTSSSCGSGPDAGSGRGDRSDPAADHRSDRRLPADAPSKTFTLPFHANNHVESAENRWNPSADARSDQ